jgi:hypothetical protein
MRFTLSFLLVLSVGCGGSNKGGTGGNGSGGGGGSSSGADMSVGGAGGGGGSSSDGGAGPDMKMPACSVPNQTGCPTGDKCVPGKGGGTCVANGSVAEGQSCTVDMTTNQDNCLAGFICDDTVGGTPLCRKVCTADSTCTTTGQSCAGFTSKYGVCLPTCTPGGTDCATGTDCSTAVDDISTTQTTENGFFVCKLTGTGAEFTACQQDTDCAAGLECDSTGQQGIYWCLPNCNTATACPTAPGTDMGAVTLACNAFANQANGAGYCAGQ